MIAKFESARTFMREDEFPLGPNDERPFKTETYNQWVYDPVQDLGLNIWIASGQGADGRDLSSFLSTIVVFYKGEVFVSKSFGDDNHTNGAAAGNCFLTVVEPFKRLKIDYLGLLHNDVGIESGASRAAPAPQLGRMDLVVDMVSPPIEQGSQGDRGEVASSGSVPRIALRYEQLCHIKGEVQIGDRRLTVDCLGMRSHRRNSTSIYSTGAVGHTWATGLFPSGKGFHILCYRLQPDAAVHFLYGHYFDGTEYYEGVVLRFPHYTGSLEQERFRLEMQVGGKILLIDAEPTLAIKSEFPPEVQLTRSATRYKMDGEIGGGVLERSLIATYPSGGDFVASTAPAK